MLDQPPRVRLYDGKFPDDIEQADEIVSLHLAAGISDIVLLLGFDLGEKPKNPNKLLEHRAHVYRTLVKHAIEDNPEVQWVLVDHPGAIRKDLSKKDNLTQDTLENVLAMLDA